MSTWSSTDPKREIPSLHFTYTWRAEHRPYATDCATSSGFWEAQGRSQRAHSEATRETIPQLTFILKLKVFVAVLPNLWYSSVCTFYFQIKEFKVVSSTVSHVPLCNILLRQPKTYSRYCNIKCVPGYLLAFVGASSQVLYKYDFEPSQLC